MHKYINTKNAIATLYVLLLVGGVLTTPKIRKHKSTSTQIFSYHALGSMWGCLPYLIRKIKETFRGFKHIL